MNLKKRIVIWYTLWTLLLTAIIFLLFFSFSNTLSIRSLRHDVEEALSDSSSLIRISDGRLNFFKLDEVDDGIYISVYDEDGTLLFGRPNATIDSVPYREGQRLLQTIDGTWVLSDMMMAGCYMRASSLQSSIYAVLASDYLPLLIAAPFFVLISALGGYFIVKKSFSPLEDLIATASEIAGGRDLSKRLDTSSSTEGRMLASAFNSMLSRLDESFRKEKEFTDDASHELRTPVAVIKAEGEYALSSLDDKVEVEEALSTIVREADRMNRLISSLLALSRSDKGTLKVDKKMFSLSSLLCVIAEEMGEIAKEKALTFSSHIENDVSVFADEDMIARAVVNLINNAISFSKPSGSISFSLKKENGHALVSVADDGIGIRKEDQERIFDRFYQVDKARTSSSSGLGLAMVKEIASLNGAEIKVESEYGEGSVFTLSIPLKNF